MIFLSACAGSNAQQNYAHNILNRPDPHDEGERVVECGWLGGEQARMQNLGDSGSDSAAPREAAYYRIVTTDNIGVIQSRMNYLRCDKPPQMVNAAYTAN